MESRQKCSLPKDRYPIEVVSVRKNAGDKVHRDEILGIYQYSGWVEVRDRETGETRKTPEMVKVEWRSPYAGKVEQVNVRSGQVVKDPSYPLVVICEPCGHPVQVRGICALCGENLSIGTFLGTETTRATISMSHDALGVTVSKDIAKQLDQNTSQRLVKERRLTLILDLDQTLVHATIDPTVRDWMADPTNPNYGALQDIHVFDIRGHRTHYVKLRPGTREFLSRMNELFEMHIYTMGSRQYAEKIADIIDPDRHLFKNRILSRDESGSQTMKSVQRLFPFDQSMVIVVDDRSDVWNWSPNLYKIWPFTFFVGTGDINALPTDVIPERNRRLSQGTPEAIDPNPQTASGSTETVEDTGLSTEEAEEMARLHEDQQRALEEEIEKSRPLEKIGEEAGETDEEDEKDGLGKRVDSTSSMEDDTAHSPAAGDTVQAMPVAVAKKPGTKPHRKRPVLLENDRELVTVQDILEKVHQRFYEEIQTNAERRKADVRVIMQQWKRQVLDGCNIAFSGVFSSNVDPRRQDLWIAAENFGAKCYTHLVPDITHVVCIQRGRNPDDKSEKVRHAMQMVGVNIVKPEWLLLSIARWKWQPEAAYLVEPVCVPSEEPIDEDLDPEDLAILQESWEPLLGPRPEGPVPNEDDEEIDRMLADDSDTEETADEAENEMDTLPALTNDDPFAALEAAFGELQDASVPPTQDAISLNERKKRSLDEVSANDNAINNSSPDRAIKKMRTSDKTLSEEPESTGTDGFFAQLKEWDVDNEGDDGGSEASRHEELASDDE
ncbi:Carboxy-terminal domain (CTD) phosphatase [Gaertneriomyces sp. JEL0708]|nr:Carboxy-terminal domain (CTD) phosphatase [Gaertneriomyces sp. JEL0708]